MPTPFSMLGAPSAKPTAVGESGFHLPMMPMLSGQDAVDSLVGYYPTKRMDSRLNPHTYQRPSAVRSTTMPNTKVAEMRRNFIAVKLASLDLTKSALVRGFIEKCAAADLAPHVAYEAVLDAMRVHPLITDEFEKCGMEKVAIGSGNGLFLPGVTSGNNSGYANSPKPATPAPKLTSPPMSSPSRASLLTGSRKTSPAPVQPARAPVQPARAPVQSPGVAAARDENWFTAPFNAARELWSGGPVAQHFFGFTRRDQDGNDIPNVSNASAPGLSAGQYAGGVVRTGLAGLGALPAVPVDIARAVFAGDRDFDYSKMMARDLLTGVNMLYGTNIGHDVQARPADIPNDLYIGPDEGRQFFGNNLNPSTGEQSLSATKARAAQLLRESQRPNSEGGTAFGRIMNAAQYPLMEYSEPILTSMMATKLPGVNKIPYVNGAAAGVPLIPLGSAAYQASTEFQENPNVAEAARVTATQHLRDADAAAMVDTQIKREQGLIGQPEVGSMFTDIRSFAEKAPVQARQLYDQTVQQLDSFVKSPKIQSEIAGAMKSGDLGPAGQKGALTALTSEGFDWDTATQMYGKMSMPEKIGLWSGVGLAGIGLINAMAGGNGLASILMTLLGLGTAGFSAGMGGLLDRGSQDFTTGLSDAVGGGPQSEIPAWLKSTLPTVLTDAPALGGLGQYLNGGRDSVVTAALQEVAKNPALARRMDQAAGVGSWGNSALSWLGDMSGLRQQQMQQMLGINPQQQDKLLQLWTQMRGQ